jgi:hypothetical protein
MEQLGLSAEALHVLVCPFILSILSFLGSSRELLNLALTLSDTMLHGQTFPLTPAKWRSRWLYSDITFGL